MDLDKSDGSRPVDHEEGPLGVAVDWALLVGHHGTVFREHLAAEIRQERVPDAVGFGKGLQCGSMIGAHAHDLGVQGFELRQGRVEAPNLLRSGAGERLDERVDDHRTLGGEIGQLDLLPGRVR